MAARRDWHNTKRRRCARGTAEVVNASTTPQPHMLTSASRCSELLPLHGRDNDDECA